MASIRERNGRLIADFRYMGIRCRETTSLEDNAYNRRVLKKRLEQLEAEITLGTFEYEKYFPKSKKIDDFKEKRSQQIAVQTQVPLFKDFTALWFKQKQIEWRGSYQQKVAIVIKNYLLPAFGNLVLTKIKKSDLLNFRASLAKVTHGKNQTSLKASRINQIMTPLRMILNDAAERYEFESPYKNINNLKEVRLKSHLFLWRMYIKLSPRYVMTSNLITPSAFLRACVLVKLMAFNGRTLTYHAVKSISEKR